MQSVDKFGRTLLLRMASGARALVPGRALPETSIVGLAP